MRNFLIFLLKGLALTWPLYIIGIVLSNYPISVPFIIYISFTGILISTAKFQQTKKLYIYLIFASYLITSVIFLSTKTSSILSVFVLILFSLSLFNSLSLSLEEKKKILTFLQIGLFCAIIFQIIEIAYFLKFHQKIQFVVSSGIAQQDVSNLTEWKAIRFHSFFDEPAHYAIYLLYVNAIFNEANKNGYFIYKKSTKILLFISLLISQSLGGILLYIIYTIFIVPMGFDKKSFSLLKLSKYFIGFIFATILVTTIAMTFFNEQTNKFANRLERLNIVIKENSFQSEGARVNAYLLAFDFFKGDNILFGEGYGNKSKILETNYNQEQGRVANSFINILIRLGIIGLSLYIIAILGYLKLLPKPLFILILLIHFYLGYFLSYMFWVPLLISKILFNEKKDFFYYRQKAVSTK